MRCTDTAAGPVHTSIVALGSVSAVPTWISPSRSGTLKATVPKTIPSIASSMCSAAAESASALVDPVSALEVAVAAVDVVDAVPVIACSFALWEARSASTLTTIGVNYY